MAVVSVEIIASTLKVDKRRIQQLCVEGMPKERHGQYDLGKCMLWYIYYLQNKLKHRDYENKDVISDQSDKARLAAIKADDAELDFRLKQKSLCLVEDVRKQWGDECAAMRARLLSIPATVSVRIDSTTTQQQREQILRDEIHEALAALSGEAR